MILELLAPAGNLEKLKIAFHYGADAVYLAGQVFSLRKAANNFSESDMQKGIEFAHNLGKKVYVTVNAFLHENETEELTSYLKTLKRLQPDALICSDLGVVKLATKHTSIPIHVSTQASVINSYHAKLWKDFGAKRVVVGRELSIKQASKIKNKVGIEVEMFAHGAMCMAYSGHCFMSTYVAQRDSNRGGCIQNCRYEYSLYRNDRFIKDSYFLSSKDLCGVSLLDDFIQAGIDSIKIEGRMKSNLYVATTVKSYASELSGKYTNSEGRIEKWKDELNKIPHRGYTNGSLETDADLNSVYNQAKEIGKEYKMAGTVIEVDKISKRFAFQVKNKLVQGDIIEILTFKGKNIEIFIDKLEDVDSHDLQVAQPHKIIWLPWQDKIEINNVGRLKSS